MKRRAHTLAAERSPGSPRPPPRTRSTSSARSIELERKIEELVRVSGDAPALRPQIAPAGGARARAAAGDLRRPQRPGRRCSCRGTRRGPTRWTTSSACSTGFVELHGDRRFGDDPAIVGGFGTFDGTPVLVARPPEGAQHQGERAAQLRPAQARGLPQGAAADGAGGAHEAADPLPHRHAGRLPGHRRRGARPGRGHRQEPRGHGRACRCRSSAR